MVALPKLIMTAGTYFVAIPLLLAILRFRFLNQAMKNIAYYVFLGAGIQFIASYLKQRGQNNLWVLHLFTPLEFGIILRFFSFTLAGFIPKKVFVWAAAAFLLAALLNSIFLQDIRTFNTYARSLEGVSVIVLCLLWCYKTLTEMKIQQLGQDPVFWANTGFLLYFSGGVLLFAFSNYIIAINQVLSMYIWAFHAMFSMLLYTLITVALWKAK